MAARRPKTKLIIVGSSGHASVLVDAIELSAAFTIVGYLDDTQPAGTIQGGYPVLGPLAEAPRIFPQMRVPSAVLAIGDNWQRRRIRSTILRACPSLNYPIVRHPSAVVAGDAKIGEGTALLAFSHVGPSSLVGAFCILNTGSSLDHDCNIADFSSLAPGAFTGGLVNLGECSAVGVGAAISDRISIGSYTVIGTGSVVVRDIPERVVAYGSPARAMRSRSESERYLE